MLNQKTCIFIVLSVVNQEWLARCRFLIMTKRANKVKKMRSFVQTRRSHFKKVWTGQDEDNWRHRLPLDQWCAHYQAYLSKTDGRYYDQRFFPKNRLILSELSPWGFTINSACPACTKTWSYNSVYCYSCSGCAHCKCIGKEFYKKHDKAKDFDKITFMCCYWMDRIKINLEAYHLSLGLNKPLRLIEIIIFFHSSKWILPLTTLICSRRYYNLSTSIVGCL